MKRAALYMRVSSLDQRPESQLYDLQQLASQRGYEIVKEYTDKISGAKGTRPMLDELLSSARLGNFDVIMVRSLSDVARSVKQCLAVLDQLNQLGIGFVSCRDNIDTTEAATMGQAMVLIVRGMAELERNLRIEKVRAGMRRSKLEGVRLGRKPLDVDRAEIVKDRVLGLSITEVAKKHGVSRGTVCRLVKLAGVQADSLSAVHKTPPPSLNRHEPYPTLQVSAVPALLGCASAES